MELLPLPEVPAGLVVTRELVDRLELLRHDDDYGTFDLYIGAAEALITEAFIALEQRIIALER